MDQEGEDVKKETSSEDSKTESPSEEEQNTDSSESPSSNAEKTKEGGEEKKPLEARKPSSEPQTKVTFVTATVSTSKIPIFNLF